MLKPIAAFVVASAALMPGAFADPTPTTNWYFYETSAVPDAEGAGDLIPGMAEAQLTMPAEGIDYSYVANNQSDCSATTASITGNTDWSLNAAASATYQTLSLPLTSVQPCRYYASVDLSVSDGLLSGHIIETNDDNWLEMYISDDVVTNSLVGTDGAAFGFAFEYGQGLISGYWQDPLPPGAVAAPEPASLPIFGAGLLFCWAYTRRHHPTVC